MSVRHALLALLEEGPKYGLQLRQEFEAQTREIWPLNVGQVYTTLNRLERDGLIAPDASADGNQQHTFAITAAGHRELIEWLRTPPALTTPPRDELVIKVLVAMRLPDIDIHDLLQVHRRKALEAMQQYTGLRTRLPANDVEFAVVIDAEVYRIEGLVRWLDSAGSRLTGWKPAVPPRGSPSPRESSEPGGNTTAQRGRTRR